MDATEAETMRSALARMVDAHRRTLDQLSTGVAMFDAEHRLTFYNAAYRALWDLDAAYLEQGPTDSAVLDALARRAQAARGAAISGNGRRSCTKPTAPSRRKEQTWHLPDGRTLRVVTTPNPDGGVTYLFDDVTERLDLERRFEELIRVQGETLDNLAEGVAVFGSDGRMRLSNSAFAAHVAAVAADARRAAAYRDDHGAVPAAARRRRRPGRRCARSSPRSTTAKRSRTRSSAATAAWSIARPCRCPTAPHW